MLRSTLAAVLFVTLPAIAAAQGNQAPINLLPPAAPREAPPNIPAADKPLLEEPTPGFQPLRPLEAEAPPDAAPVQAAPVQPPPVQAEPPAPRLAEPLPSAPLSVPQASPLPVPPPQAEAEPARMPMGQPAAMADVTAPPAGLPSWALGVLVLAGAFLAALFGILTALLMRRAETRARRRAVAATLATELETRAQAFEAVPLPPNVEAGVSFVSSVTSLAGIDAGFRSTQGSLHLLPEKLAAHVSVHYAAVQRVSDFVKGQSLAAAVRMLQANRIGGHPCPDAGAMRDAHVELGMAFRGVEKLTQMLKKLR